MSYSRNFHISAIVIAVFFLLLISPFNQKIIQEQINEPELSFITARFFAYLVWIIFFITVYAFLLKKKSKLYYPFLLCNILAFLSSMIISYGLDITDEGWQLAKSWGLLHGSIEYNNDLIWGSSFVSGLWLSVINSPSIIWARIGNLIFLPFFGIIIFSVLKKFFSEKLAFLSVLLSFLFFYRTFLIYNSVNYYTLPVFSLLLSFYFLTQFFISNNNSLKNLVFSSLFVAISIHLKFTFAAAVPLFLIYLYFFSKKNKVYISAIQYYSVLIVSYLLILFLLSIFGDTGGLSSESDRLSVVNMFKTLFGNGQVNSSLNYSFTYLFSKYFKDMHGIIKESSIFFLLFAGFGILSLKVKKFRIPSILFASIFLLFSFITFSDNVLQSYSLIFAVSVLILLFNKVLNENIFYLLFIFLSLLIVSFIGSGLSFYTGLISLGFMGFVSFVLCLLYSSSSELIDLKVPFFSILFFLLLFQISKTYSPYRDLPVTYLNTMFKSTELTGIYSFKERVDVVDEFMEFAKSENIRSKKMIFVGMPMFYYLLDVNPVISETHDVILGFEQLKKEVIEAEPEVIVMPVQSPRGHLWPLPQNAKYWTNDGFERQTAHYYKFYREYIEENNFNKIFENAMFIAYRKSDVILEATE
ncbi:TPA: hypothetical protein DCR49_04600 [Candidatus Delongbacteria bacterium]|nr:MAG: hypothetical protein A2Y39_06170 [Candidatus Delongbacteria bacterium GWF2_40_14]HAQ61267.1 hypothetical protein [Candidatus Delongbacteria bacterium]